MRALTLLQPWATLIAGWDGLPVGRRKRIENRSWRPPQALIGQRLAIHAGKGVDDEGVADVEDLLDAELPDLPSGAIVAVATVVGAVQLEGDRVQHIMGGRPSWAPDHVDDLARRRDDYWLCGPIGWLLDDVHTLPTPVPARGAQGLWTLPSDVEAAVLRGLGLAPAGPAPFVADLGRCRSCGRDVLWLVTTAGKRMPCDLGQVWLVEDPQGGQIGVSAEGATITGYGVGGPGRDVVEVRTSHFATCPEAAKWRKAEA